MEKLRANRASVNVEQGDVIVENLVEQNDELHKVRVCLLPERLLAPPEQVVQQRCNSKGERIGILVVVQGIVAVVGLEADLQIVLAAVMLLQELANLETEVAFYFEHEGADASLGIGGAIGKNLFRKRHHAATRLAGADGSEDGDAGEQSLFGDREPPGMFRRRLAFGLMNLTQD